MFHWAQQNSDELGHMFFRRKNGKRSYQLRTHEVSNAIKEAADAFGLPRHLFSAKSCRVGASTSLAAAGVDQSVNMRLLGHASNESNQMYQRASVNTRGALDLPTNLTVVDTRRAVVFKNKNGKKSRKVIVK
jgi:integrase